MQIPEKNYIRERIKSLDRNFYHEPVDGSIKDYAAIFLIPVMLLYFMSLVLMVVLSFFKSVGDPTPFTWFVENVHSTYHILPIFIIGIIILVSVGVFDRMEKKKGKGPEEMDKEEMEANLFKEIENDNAIEFYCYMVVMKKTIYDLPNRYLSKAQKLTKELIENSDQLYLEYKTNHFSLLHLVFELCIGRKGLFFKNERLPFYQSQLFSLVKDKIAKDLSGYAWGTKCPFCNSDIKSCEYLLIYKNVKKTPITDLFGRVTAEEYEYNHFGDSIPICENCVKDWEDKHANPICLLNYLKKEGYRVDLCSKYFKHAFQASTFSALTALKKEVISKTDSNENPYFCWNTFSEVPQHEFDEQVKFSVSTRLSEGSNRDYFTHQRFLYLLSELGLLKISYSEDFPDSPPS